MTTTCLIRGHAGLVLVTIALGSAHAMAGGVCAPPEAPLAEPAPPGQSVGFCDGGDNHGLDCEVPADCPNGTCVVATRTTNRYLAFQTPASWSGQQLALRVTLINVDGFESFNDETRWIAAPQSYPDREGGDVSSTFRAGRLDCSPVFRDWHTGAVLYTYGSEVVPSTYVKAGGTIIGTRRSVYAIQAVPVGCEQDEAAYSPSLYLTTAVYGDVTTPFDGDQPGVFQPNLGDFGAFDNHFTSRTGTNTPTKPRVQLQPNTPEPGAPASVRDAGGIMNGFVGRPYPFEGPETCPHRVPFCGDGFLDPAEECDDGNAVSSDGCDATCHVEFRTARVSLVPVGSTGSSVINGNEILLAEPDQYVRFELFVSDWDVDQVGSPKLDIWQVAIDGAGFTSGLTGQVERPTVPCFSDNDCVIVLGAPAKCSGISTLGVCLAALADSSHPNKIAASVPHFVDPSTDDVRFGGTSLLVGNTGDPGVPQYAGTLLLHVSADATGSFVIDFHRDFRSTFLLDGTPPVPDTVPIGHFEPAVVTVPQGCCTGATCSAAGLQDCLDAGGTPVAVCGGDCNDNGVDDACEIAAGAADCNLNGTPDECEADCNDNGQADECDVLSFESGDCNDNGVPDECEPQDDCNGNGRQDLCDIASGVSGDCNFDLVPDDCQPNTDCNTNGIRDICEIGAGTEQDCNGNFLPDSCDIAGGAPDDNADGVPDECCQSPTPLFVGPLKSRYLSLESIGTPGVRSAIRVSFVDNDAYPEINGTSLWVGPPHDYPEEDSSTPGSTFVGANLSCRPHYQDWSTIDLLHVLGGEMVPGSAYEVQLINEGCPDSFESNFSASQAGETGRWGDMVPPFDSPGNPPQPDFSDISACVKKFQAAPDAPIKALAQLQPAVVRPERPISFNDIAAAVAAFTGQPYGQSYIGETPPCTCPSSVICDAASCASDYDCSVGGGGDRTQYGICFNGFCTDFCGRCAP